jgi:hypothetical protein
MFDFYFIARIICQIKYDENQTSILANNCSIVQKHLAEFCEGMLVKVDPKIDFHLFEFPNDGLINPVKLCSADDIKPYTTNLIKLRAELLNRLNHINKNNYLNFYDGIGFYIAFKLKGHDHWLYNFCEASDYMSNMNPEGTGHFEIKGYSPYIENEIIDTIYKYGNYEEGFMVYYIEGDHDIYESAVPDFIIPELFTDEWYEVDSALRNKFGKNYHKNAANKLKKSTKSKWKSNDTLHKTKDLITGNENKADSEFFNKLNAQLGFTKRENPVYNTVIEVVLRRLDFIIEQEKMSFSKYNPAINNYLGYFDLSSPYGAYETNAYGLVHNIMCNENIYSIFLNERCSKMLQQMLEEEPAGIFGLNEEDEDYEQIQYEFLNRIYADSIIFIGRKLLSLGYELSKEYATYLEDR